MKGKMDINFINKIVTAVGNSAHVVVPKDWIGKEVYVIPIEVWQDAQLDDIMKGHRFRVMRGRRKK